MLSQAHRSADGSYRAVAARAIPGTPLGGFRYHGTRPDDPNDVVPHEHRRELRALKVFAAWVNLTDMKAGNTLDTRVTENGRTIVRHYLQDVGSALGSGALGPHDPDEGWEYLFDGDKMMKRAVSFGFYLQPWQTARYEKHVAAGRFEGDAFDPLAWRPRTPSGAFVRARPDDTFWAARRVQAFSSEMIRAIVKSGAYSDPNAERLHRRHADQAARQGRRRLSADDQPAGRLRPGRGRRADVRERRDQGRHRGAAVGRLHRAVGHVRQRHRRDPAARRDQRGRSRRSRRRRGWPRRREPSSRLPSPALDQRYPSWGAPVTVHFKRQPQNWKLVGVERLP